LKLNGNIRESLDNGSLPLRGAWVEIYKVKYDALKETVAPLAGSVG